jgi:predicted RNA-binding protein with PUA-like domain
MTTWLFQGNPSNYTLDEYLRANMKVTWHVNQQRFAREMGPGDEVYIWRSDGLRPGTAGVVAVGVLTGRPGDEQDDGLGTWLDKKPAASIPSVRVLLHEIRLTDEDGFLSKRALLTDSVLSQLLVIRMPRATNYRLSEEEAQQLSQLWRERGCAPE